MISIPFSSRNLSRSTSNTAPLKIFSDSSNCRGKPSSFLGRDIQSCAHSSAQDDLTFALNSHRNSCICSRAFIKSSSTTAISSAANPSEVFCDPGLYQLQAYQPGSGPRRIPRRLSEKPGPRRLHRHSNARRRQMGRGDREPDQGVELLCCATLG